MLDSAPASNVLPFPTRGTSGTIVAIEPMRSMRELAALRPIDADYMPATIALVLLQGWHEEAQYYERMNWRELRELTIARMEAMRVDTCAAPRVQKALEIIRDCFAAKLREARA